MAMIQAPLLKTLPPAYYEKIGLVITKFGILEWRLRDTLYTILRLTPKQGRLTIGSPRPETILDRIRDLMALEGISTNRIAFNDIRKALVDMADIRNDLAHGIWLHHPATTDQPILQKVTGSYTAAGDGGSTKSQRQNARINPRAMSLTPAEMEEIAAAIDKTIATIDRLKHGIEKRLPKQRG